MQTFLVSPSFGESAKALDRQRLGKQRVEVWQILKALAEPNYGWQNHPAVKMWKGHTFRLCQYGLAICNRWKSFGYDDTIENRINLYMHAYPDYPSISYPSWWNDDRLFSSHRAALLAKDFGWYSRFGWKEKPEIKYFWPTKNGY
jgi:hypothetical protein